jgi:hypothetical protein
VEAVSPLTTVAVTAAVPAALAVKVLPLTTAPVVPALVTVQVLVFLVAFAGSTVPLRVRGVPAVAAEGRPLIFVTGTKAGGSSPPLTVMVNCLV